MQSVCLFVYLDEMDARSHSTHIRVERLLKILCSLRKERIKSGYTLRTGRIDFANLKIEKHNNSKKEAQNA